MSAAEIEDERDIIALETLAPHGFAAALHRLAMSLRAQAADIEGEIAHACGVPYGHDHASNEDSRTLREAADAIDITRQRLHPEFCPKKASFEFCPKPPFFTSRLLADKTTQNSPPKRQYLPLKTYIYQRVEEYWCFGSFGNE